jgi:O-antigen ligase
MTDIQLAVAVVAVPGLLLLGVLTRRPSALAVCLVPLSFPVGDLPVPGLPMQVVQVVTVAAVTVVALRWLRRGRPVAPASPVLLGAGLAVLVALLATVTATDPATALRIDVGHLLGLGLAVAVTVACRDLRSLGLVALATCAAGGIVGATGLGSASELRAEYGGALVENRADGVFGQPNELGGFAAAMLVLSLALLLAGRDRHPAARLVVALATAGSAAALALSLSRGAWIGAVLGIGVLLVLLPVPGRRRLLVTLAAVVLAGATAPLVAPDQPAVSVVADRMGALATGERNPYDERPEIWREAVRQLDGSPALGVGPGGYPERAAERPTLREAAPLHAHSLVLTVGAELGLLGLAGLLGVVAAGVATVLRSRRTAGRRHGDGAGEEILAGAAAALTALLGQGLVDYPLGNPVLGTLLWLLVGMLAAAATRVAAAASGQTVFEVRRPVNTGLAPRFSPKIP